MLLTVLSFFGPSSARAQEQEPVCETRLISKYSLRYNHALRMLPTIQFVGELKGAHGGTLSILEVPEQLAPSWASQYQIYPRAPQGDPRQIVSLLGASLAYYLGIREIEELKITIPNTAEVNGALDKLSRALVELGYESIPIRYYQQAESDKKSYFYVTTFYEKFMLPLATENSLHVHDISYHLSSVILTRELLAPVIEKYRHAIEFYQYAYARSSDELTRKRLDRYLSVLDMKIDVGLGNIQTAFIKRARLEIPDFVLQDIRRKYQTRDEQTKAKQRYYVQFLQYSLQDFWRTLTFNGENEMRFVDLALREAMDKDFMNADKIWHLYDSFWSQEKFKGFKDNKVLLPSGVEIYNKIMKRHEEMVRALNLLKKKESP